MKILLFGFVFSATAFSQLPAFDAATIKVAPAAVGGMLRVGMNGGPGSKDPGLFRCDNCTVSMLVIQAWDLKNYQLARATASSMERYNVTARVPDGATKEQFRLMLQNLLAERFKLTVHHDKKEVSGYELVVAKGGVKMKESSPPDPEAVSPEAPGSGRMQMGKDGFPVLPKMSGRPIMMMMNGRARSVGSGVPLEELANSLTSQVGGKPVTDATGLKGKYDYTLTWEPENMLGGMMMPPPGGGGGDHPAPENAEPLPNIFAAVQEQLGLRLEPRKVMVDLLVVDHVEKAPTEN